MSKTLITIDTNVSKYIFNDEDEVVLFENKITTPSFEIADMNSHNSTLIENVTPPSDWVGCKYLFGNNTWELNPDYIEVTNV